MPERHGVIAQQRRRTGQPGSRRAGPRRDAPRRLSFSVLRRHLEVRLTNALGLGTYLRAPGAGPDARPVIRLTRAELTECHTARPLRRGQTDSSGPRPRFTVRRRGGGSTRSLAMADEMRSNPGGGGQGGSGGEKGGEGGGQGGGGQGGGGGGGGEGGGGGGGGSGGGGAGGGAVVEVGRVAAAGRAAPAAGRAEVAAGRVEVAGSAVAAARAAPEAAVSGKAVRMR